MATEVKQVEAYVLKERLKNSSIIMCIMSICSVVLGMYLNYGYTFDIKVCIYALAFVFSYDFLMIFYLEINKAHIFKARISSLLLAVIPGLCMFFIHFDSKVIAGVIIIFLITLLSGLVNFTVSGLTLFMVFVYTVFNPTYTADIGIEVVLYTFCLCLFARHVTSVKTLVYSIGISAVFYAIVGIFTFDFSLSELFGTTNIVYLLIGIASLIIVSALAMVDFRYTVMRNKSLYFLLPDGENDDSDIEDDKLFLLPNKSTNKLVDAKIPVDTVSKEEYDNLSERLNKVNTEKEELLRKLSTVSESKAFVFSDICSEDSDFVKKLKSDTPNIYEHSMLLASYCRKAADMIMCDSDMAYVLGVFHESSRVLGISYQSLLRTRYKVPDYILRAIGLLSQKQVDKPINREIAIVMLLNDMLHTFSFVVKNPGKFAEQYDNPEASWTMVVKNTIKVRNEQNLLRLAGYTKEEVTILRDYFISIGGNLIDAIV